MKERSSLKVLAMASSIRWPACVSQGMEAIATSKSMLTGMTSRPIPSPGIRPIRSDLEAIEDHLCLLGVLQVRISDAKISHIPHRRYW